MSGSHKDLSIYIHIPFCTKKCPYCHFYVIADNERLKDMLLQALLKEISVHAAHIEGRRIVSIYFGGGTPSLFGPKRIGTLIAQCTPDPLCEITLEINPEESSQELIKEFCAAGINRMSFGVQSLKDNELQILGRNHSGDRAKQAIFHAVDAGIHNVSLDLMYETPKQTLDTFRESLQTAAALPITHLSLYNLTFEEGTPFLRKESILRPLIVPEEIGAAMYQEAIDILPKNGLKQYEVSAFCREGQLSVHNTGYWTGREFLGFGPSAFSYFKEKRFRNIANLSRYASLVFEGASPVDFTDDVDIDSRKKEILALNVRLLEGISLSRFETAYGKLDHETHAALQKLIEQDLLERSGDRIALTRRGLLFYDTVASEII